MVWKAEQFSKTLKRLMPKSDGWKFFDDGEAKDEDKLHQKDTMDLEDIAFQLLPCFVLLKLHYPAGSLIVKSTDVLPSRELCRGMNVKAIGTPFGNLSPDVFLNCMSDGILCNVVGNKKELLLTDARCISGSEGGALYASEDQKEVLIGMIVSPLCWKNSEWVGLTVGCSMSEVLRSLRKMTHHRDIVQFNVSKDTENIEEHMLHSSIVMVEYGATWGSGILFKDGAVVTCSHVVKFNKKAKVRIKVFLSHIPMWINGSVVFASPEGAVLDAAVIQLDNVHRALQVPHWNIASVTEGMPVYMIGHGLFGDSHGLEPSVMKGCVAKVSRVNGVPVMIQSTCAVSGGASGGPLVDSKGRLVAMVTCNAKDKDSGVTFPHINMAVPASIFWPIVHEYIETQDPSVLSKLHVRNKDTAKLWNLTPNRRSWKSSL